MYNVVRVFNLGGVWKLNLFFFSLNSNDIEIQEVPSEAYYLVCTKIFSGDEQVMRSSRKETLGNANKDVPTLWLLTWVSPNEHWILCQKEVVVISSFLKMRKWAENARQGFGFVFSGGEGSPSNSVEDVWVCSVFLFIYRHFCGTHHHNIWANLSFPVSCN